MGTWSYLWSFIFSFFLWQISTTQNSKMVAGTEKATMLTEETNISTTPAQNNIKGYTNREQDIIDSATWSLKTIKTEPRAKTTLVLHDTALATSYMMRMAGGEGMTETEPKTQTLEVSSLGVSAGTTTTSIAFPNTRPESTATSVGTVSVPAAFLSLRPSSAVMSHSSSSSVISATANLQRSSTIGSTEKGLSATSHPSTAIASSSAPGVMSIESSAVGAEAVTHSPASSTPSPMPLASATHTSPKSDTTKDILLSTPASSAEMQAAEFTSTSLTQRQTTVVPGATSSSIGNHLPAAANISLSSPTMISPGKGESPTTNQQSGMTIEPTSHVLPVTSLAIPSTTWMADGEGRTETAPVMPTHGGTSLGVPTRSEATSLSFPTTRLKPTAPIMGTVSGTAASLSLRPNSDLASYFSSPVFSSAATTNPQRSSTFGSTEVGLSATSHPSMAITSSSTPTIMTSGSGVVTAETMTHSPAPSTLSSTPLASAATTSLAPDTMEAGQSSTSSGSLVTQAVQLTSTSLTQSQATTEPGVTSSSVQSLLPDATTVSASGPATTPTSKSKSPTTNQGDGTTADPNTKTSHALFATSLATLFTRSLADGEGRTGAALTTPTQEVGSHVVPTESETTSSTIPMTRPYVTDTIMGTASSTATSLSLSPSSTLMSHFSSSPVGSSAATPNPQQSSSIGSTEVGLYATSHPSTAITSSTPSNPGATVSSAVTAEAMTHSPVPSMPSPVFTARTSPMSDTTKDRLSSMPAGSGETQAVQLTSRTLIQGETTRETGATSSSMRSHLPDTASIFASSPATTPPSMTSEHTSLVLSDTLLTTPSTTWTAGGEGMTETAPILPTHEESSFVVSTRSEATSPTFSTRRPNTTAPITGTVSGTAASLSLRPSSASVSHSTSSSPVISATTANPQQSSTSGTTETDLSAASHPSTALASSTSFSVPHVTSRMTTEPSANTSSVHPATSLFSPSMTHFMESTSVNSFTTTCLPVSIEVQNVTGEAIELSWTGGRRGSLYGISLMDGNWEINKTTTTEAKMVFKHLLPGHIYTISVSALSCAENSQNESVTVRTDSVSCFDKTEFCLPQNTGCPDLKYIVCSNYQTFACSVLLKSQTFNHTLYNSDSEDYKTMSESIKTEIPDLIQIVYTWVCQLRRRITSFDALFIDNYINRFLLWKSNSVFSRTLGHALFWEPPPVVREMRVKLNDDHFDIIMLGFRPGSVIAYFISLLQKQESIDVNDMQAQLSQILKAKFGDQSEVTLQYVMEGFVASVGQPFKTFGPCFPGQRWCGFNTTKYCRDAQRLKGKVEIVQKALSVQSSSGNSSGWKVAVIVLGVLLGAALVLILLLTLGYIYMKKRLGTYFVEPNGLLGNFFYKHL